MDDGKIFDEIVNILKLVVPHQLEDLSPESRLVEDVGIDSLGMFEMLVEAEDRFDIKISDPSMTGLNTIEDIINVVKSQRQ